LLKKDEQADPGLEFERVIVEAGLISTTVFADDVTAQ